MPAGCSRSSTRRRPPTSSKLDGYPAGDTPIPATPLEIAHINLDRHPEGSEPKVMAPSAAPPASEDTNVAGEAH